MKKVRLFIVFLITLGNLSQAQENIFYSSFRPQGWDIYISKDDGKTFSKFTDHESLDYDAKISIDGRWVVFTSERNGRPQLYIKSTEEDSIPRLLVTSHSMQDQVDFSPDGENIVFVSTHEGNSDIYLLPFSPLDTLDISEAVNLTNDPGGDFRPKFSNDGKFIAFSSDRGHDTKPDPRFVFAMQRFGDIYVMNADGTHTKRLTNSENWDGSPVWSTDDQEIIYYSSNQLSDNRHESSRLYKMSNTGENSMQISPDNYSCLSPLVKSDGHILFTSFVNGPNGFSILGLDPSSKDIDTTLIREMNMLNVDYHESGILIYHGGKTPEQKPTNINSFTGNLLVANSPQLVNDIPNKALSLYGVRRAFAAPGTPDGKIIYDVSEVNNFQESLTSYAYIVLLIPILAIFWLLLGIYKSVKHRKTISFWKHLIFSLVAIAIAVYFIKSTNDRLFTNLLPLDEVQPFLAIFAAILFLLGVLTYYLFKQRKKTGKPIASLYKCYTLMFIPYAVMVLYASLMLSSFFKTDKDFYAVDYTTNEVKHIFNFQPDGEFNPQFSNIIDTKITPDGKYLQFSVGGFRLSPHAKGGVYRYHFENKTLERVTDLESNTGFADYSGDNEVLVYRSGRSGNMDIYIEENGTTTNITNSPDKETFPVISSDGNKIAYCSDVNGTEKNGVVKTMDIFIVERTSNGWSKPRQLTTYSGQEGHAHFSPDGEWLIYSSEEFGINDEQPLVQPFIFSPQMYGEITAIRILDGERFRLTHNKWEDGAPLWIREN